MSKCNCEVIYKASDGKEFKTLEECKTYENRPKVYAIKSTDIVSDRHMTTTKVTYLDKVYIDQQEATQEHQRLTQSQQYIREMNRGYAVLEYTIVTLDVKLPTEVKPTTQQRITNSHKEPNKLVAWWKEFIKYKGDDK